MKATILSHFVLAAIAAIAFIGGTVSAVAQQAVSPETHLAELAQLRDQTMAIRDLLDAGQCDDGMALWRQEANGDGKGRFVATMAAQFSIELEWGCFASPEDRAVALALIEENYFQAAFPLAIPDGIFSRVFGDNFAEVLANTGNVSWMARAAAIHLLCDLPPDENPVLANARIVSRRVPGECEQARGVSSPEFSRAWYWMAAAVKQDEWPVGLNAFPGFRSMERFARQLAFQPSKEDAAALQQEFITLNEQRLANEDREAAALEFASAVNALILRAAVSSRAALDDESGALEKAYQNGLMFTPNPTPAHDAIAAE